MWTPGPPLLRVYWCRCCLCCPLGTAARTTVLLRLETLGRLTRVAVVQGASEADGGVAHMRHARRLPVPTRSGLNTALPPVWHTHER